MSEDNGTLERIVGLVSGDLDPATARLVEQAASSDPATAEVLAALRSALRALAEDDTERAPVEAVRRAIALFAPAREAVIGSWLERAGRVLAQLVYDNRAQPALAGYRSTGGPHLLAFESPVGQVDLEVSPGGASEGGASEYRVRGQVSGAGVGTGRASIIDEAGRPHVEAEIDERGCFDFHAGRGVHAVLLETSAGGIVIDGLPIGGSSTD